MNLALAGKTLFAEDGHLMAKDMSSVRTVGLVECAVLEVALGRAAYRVI